MIVNRMKILFASMAMDIVFVTIEINLHIHPLSLMDDQTMALALHQGLPQEIHPTVVLVPVSQIRAMPVWTYVNSQHG